MAMMLVMSENVMVKLTLKYQMIMTDEHVMSPQSFLHSKALPDMFIFARKDPAVLAV
jgi:hypothetical protein